MVLSYAIDGKNVMDCASTDDKKNKTTKRRRLDGNMILSVRNPVRKKVEIINNIVQKEHDSGHGIGLLNVRSVVEKYDGDLALACDEKEFRAVVIL